VADFACAYADQVDEDYGRFIDTPEAGKLH
jgi:hypothetical protein